MLIRRQPQRLILPALIAAAALFLFTPPTPVSAQDDAGGGTARTSRDIRIAVADPSRIFNEMQETKDLKEKLETERQRLAGMEKEKRDELDKIQRQRNELKPDHPQYEELNNQLMQKAMEFKVWGEVAKMEAERNQKKQLRMLFRKIEGAVGEIAKREGIDVVIADHRPELPPNLDQINFGQLRDLINQRDLLYAGERADISGAVLALLDSQYKGNPGGGGATGGAEGGGGDAGGAGGFDIGGVNDATPDAGAGGDVPARDDAPRRDEPAGGGNR